MQANPQMAFQKLSPEKQALVLKKLQARQQASSSTGADDERPTPIKERQQPLPLSLDQERLWFLGQLADYRSAYHNFSPLEVRGPLHPPTLTQVFTELIRRHEGLRTTFTVHQGQPAQIIHPPAPLVLPFSDLTHLAADERQAATRQLIAEEAQRPFDLAQGPLLRVRLVRLAPDHHLILLNLHHIITDGWSLAILYRELTTLYQAYREGRPSPLPPLSLQYADFADWQRRQLQTGRLAPHLTYWRRQLAGLPPLLELPTDAPRAAVQTTAGAVVEFTIAASLTAALKHLSQQHSATLFMTLLAAFQLLLARYSHQHDITVGTPIANRERQEFEPIVGFLANTLLLRTDLSGALTFRELLARVQQMTSAAFQHQALPFGEIVKALHPQRSLSHQPLFQVMFAFHNIALKLDSPPGLTFAPYPYTQQSAMFDLTLELLEQGEELHGRLEYSTALFQPATVARMTDHFCSLLQAIVTNPQQRIDTLPLLTDAERAQLLVTWQQPATEAVQPAVAHAIHHWFEWQVEQTPEALALICGNEQLTYRQLNQRANQLAHALVCRAKTKGMALGAGTEMLIAICLERSAAMVVSLLAILKAGGAYLPLDPATPPERLAYILRDATVAILLTTSNLADRLGDAHVETVWLDQAQPELDRQPVGNPRQAVSGDSPAYVIYTSGSTGQPKGVVIEQQALTAHIATVSACYGLTPNDRVLQFSAFGFDAAQEQIFTALCNGATLLLRADEMWTTETFQQQVTVHGVTVADLPPVYFHHLLNAWRRQRPAFLDQQLRLILLGGEKLSPALVRQWQQLHAPATRLLNVYGPTEATITATIFDLTAYQPDAAMLDLPIGRPLPGRHAYILDSRRQPVPVGVYGELYLGGASLARGYLHQPALTAERFIEHSFSAGAQTERLYKTGDIVRWLPDGNIQFLGRTDQQVKIRGFRIELDEIAEVLRQHAAVQEAVIVPSGDDGTEQRLVAYVVTAGAEDMRTDEAPPAPVVDQGRLRLYLKQKLPDYMVPARFVFIDALPLNSNGKVDQRALPAPETLDESGAWIAPRTSDEAKLAALWAEVLGVERVSIHANFFDLGGHSLLAVRLLQRLQQADGRALPLTTLFQNPTIAQLAGVLAQPAQTTRWSPLVALQPHGKQRPFFCVHGVSGSVTNYYALARALGQAQPFYALQAVGVDGDASPHTSLVAMAQTYVAAIQTVQPQGPYLLGGHSFGGAVAFEMARQLLTQGEAVDHLVLLDSFAPGSFANESAAWDEARWLLAVVEQLEQASGQSFGVTYGDLQPLSLPEQLAWLSRRLHTKIVNTVEGSPTLTAGIDVKYLRGLLQVLQANQQMNVQPVAALSIPITLVRAEEGRAAAQALQLDATLGWQRWSTQPISVQMTAGNHFTMLTPPHLSALVERLTPLFATIAVGSHDWGAPTTEQASTQEI